MTIPADTLRAWREEAEEWAEDSAVTLRSRVYGVALVTYARRVLALLAALEASSDDVPAKRAAPKASSAEVRAARGAPATDAVPPKAGERSTPATGATRPEDMDHA